MSQIYDRLRELFYPVRIVAYLVDDLLPDLVMAGTTLLFAWLIWKLLDRVVRAMLRKSELDETAQIFIQTITRYVVVTIGLVTTLAQLGVDTTSLLTSLGIVGLTIGFAARDTLSNVISGLFIFWDRPFVISDLVEIEGQYGKVAAITMRTTRVVTADGRMLAIPNSQIINSVVVSYTNVPHLRLDVPFRISVVENIGRAREIALSLVADDPRYTHEKAPVVVVTQLNDYNVAMELRAWIEDERAHTGIRYELREKLFEALRAGNIEMPYETLSVINKAV